MRFWPLGVVGLAWFLICGPLLGAGDQVFGLLAGDGIRAAWFQDFVARNAFSWGELRVLGDFDWPNPRPRYEELSTIADSVLLAPLAWLWPWPGQWSVLQAMAVLVNGLALAWLARVVGCRGLGMCVAGCLGVCVLQVLKELHMGRINAAWVGFAVAALASWLQVLSKKGAPWQVLAKQGLLAAILGAFAVSVYPPWIALLAPMGLILGWKAFLQADGATRLASGLALGGGALLAAPQLRAILRSPRAQFDLEAPSVTQGIGAHLGGDLHVDMVLSVSDWLSIVPPSGAGIQPGVVVGTWALVLFLLPFVARRGRVLLLICWAGVLGVLSMGAGSPVGGVLSQQAWNTLGVLHDFGRFATAAGVVAALAAGIAISDAWETGSRRKRQLVLGMSVLAVAHAVTVSVGTIRDPQRWSRVLEFPGTAYLKQAPSKPTVELPYGERLGFLSVLAAPDSPRVNPINLDRPDTRPSEVVRWFGQLGVGDVPAVAPTRAAIARSGIGRVVFDTHRCGRPYSNESPRVYPWPREVPVRACGESVSQAIEQVLGAPKEVVEGVFVWEFGGTAP